MRKKLYIYRKKEKKVPEISISNEAVGEDYRRIIYHRCADFGLRPTEIRATFSRWSGLTRYG